MNIPDAIVKSQGYRESLLQLGFDDDQIKLGFGVQVINATFEVPAGSEIVTVGLYVSADPMPSGDFLITCGHAPLTWTRNLPRVMETWNELSRRERSRLYEQHQPWPMILNLAEAIEAKGITVPLIGDYRQLAMVRGTPTLVPMPPPGEAN